MTQILARKAFMSGLGTAGVLDAVQAAVNASEDTAVQLAWADDQVFDSLSPTTQKIMALSGVSPDVFATVFGD